MFSKILIKKDTDAIIKLLEEVKDKIKINKLKLDKRGGFQNKKLTKWCEDNNIELELSVPYYHESNGRVERLNRTIRDACKKNKGLLNIKLKKIVKNYNETFQRAIGMKPKEALEEVNWEK